MGVEVKICGLTRAADALAAADAGARWIGVVFAGGPRALTVPAAAEVLGPVPRGIGRVGVFASAATPSVLEAVEALELDAVQIYGPVDEPHRALAARGTPVWRVARIADRLDAAAVRPMAHGASVVLVEARVSGRLGGTGVPLDLGLAAEARAALPSSVRFGLAGGLRPETVRGAVRAVQPDIVDVSSGVETTVGVKDPARMRAFVREAHLANAG